MEGVELAPLRSIDDFLLESARFQVPTFNDPQRWANRVLNNLLYFQTNYFITVLIVFLIVGVLHPVQMILGFVAVSSAFAVFVYVTNNNVQYRSFKRKHPIMSLAIILVSGYIMMYFFGSILTFFFGIAAPMLCVILHASLRLRSIKNKLSNKIEYIGVKRTPMGLFLEALGQEQEAGS